MTLASRKKRVADLSEELGRLLNLSPHPKMSRVKARRKRVEIIIRARAYHQNVIDKEEANALVGN